VAIWLVASAVFSFYLANFGSYDRVYGALGTGIAFLVWAWILDLTLLGGLGVSLALTTWRGHSQAEGATATPSETMEVRQMPATPDLQSADALPILRDSALGG
jgi:membrane protein